MTDDEIFAEIDRIKALPKVIDVCRASGIDRQTLWEIRSRKRSLTSQKASRLRTALTASREIIEATFRVPLHSGRRSSLENRR